MLAKIIGTGSYIPKLVWDNHKLTEMIDTTDEWIQERTGIVQRHISNEKGSAQMAIEAALRAVENCKFRNQTFDVSMIDAIIVCSTTSDMYVPSMACMVQEKIGAEKAFAFDLNAACSAFVFAYQTIMGYMRLGIVKKAMIIGTEQLSRIIDWTDRGSCILFGDGAGAVVLEASEGQYGCISHSDGRLGDALLCDCHSKLKMDGQKVFRFAVKQVPAVIQELMSEMELKDEDIDYYVLHQANLRIMESVAKRLKISMEKLPMNITEMGNTSSASIPILLDDMNQKGMLKEKTRMIMAGFGAGLTWGAAYIEA